MKYYAEPSVEADQAPSRYAGETDIGNAAAIHHQAIRRWGFPPTPDKHGRVGSEAAPNGMYYYPGQPRIRTEERDGVLDCVECGAEIQPRDSYVRDGFGALICTDCAFYPEFDRAQLLEGRRLRETRKIHVVGVDKHSLVRAAYELSGPASRVRPDWDPGALPSSAVDAIAAGSSVPAGYPDVVLYVEVARGRLVQLVVARDDGGREYMWAPWPGHSDDDLRNLCERISATDPLA